MWEPSSGLSITLQDSIPSMNSLTPVSDPYFHHIRILNTMVWKCRLQCYTYQSLFFKVKIIRVTRRWYSIFKWRTQEHADSKPPRKISVKKRFLVHHDIKFTVKVLCNSVYGSVAETGAKISYPSSPTKHNYFIFSKAEKDWISTFKGRCARSPKEMVLAKAYTSVVLISQLSNTESHRSRTLVRKPRHVICERIITWEASLCYG